MVRLLQRFWSSAWTLLVLTNLFWAGNIIVGRVAAGRVPPITLAYWRWTGAFIIAIGFTVPHLKRDWPALARAWPVLLVLAATGIATYNTMSYIGLQYTTAVNTLLLQSALPLIILVWAFVLFRERPNIFQSMGVIVSLLGVTVIAAQGSLAKLTGLSINVGDIWIISALVIYGLYSPLLRRRPPVHPLSLLVTLMGIGSLMMLPFYLWELGTGATIRGGWPSYAAMAYTSVLPSLVAYLFLNRAVELIGAGRAGQSAHLMPVFGTVLAVVFLGERVYGYHLVGIALIAAGIALASRRAGRLQAPAEVPGE